FFDSFDDLCNLHSFPTRRSSDLTASCGNRQKRAFHQKLYSARPVGVGVGGGGHYYFNPDRPVAADHAVWVGGHVGRADAGFQRRSEEHTSELQSRENIVCRLLLE